MKGSNLSEYFSMSDNSLDSSLVSDVLCGYHPSLFEECNEKYGENKLRLLSLFSGCGGMDIGFEGNFICHKKSIPKNSPYIKEVINDDWIKVHATRFKTVFANDILNEARVAWNNYMIRHGHTSDVFHFGSIVDFVKMEKDGIRVFPMDVDIVTGGFPCQDFSVAGKRKGFDSSKNHMGRLRSDDEPTEETRGKLYIWMKEVISIVRPKIFIAENVKGLVNLGDVKNVIQNDFASASDNGYLVLSPKVLHAADYGVPESRERVIFIGLRKDALTERAIDMLSREIIPDEFNPYPSPTHAYSVKDKNLMPPVVCGDVLSGLKEPEVTLDFSQGFFSKAKYMGKHCQGQTEIDLRKIGPTIRSEHHGNIEYRRLSINNGGKNIKELNLGLKERRLTPRECALIQTFPPDYVFVSKKSNNKFLLSPSGAYKVIGNAVPPVLAYNIAIKIESIWNNLFL